jgi:hypothetical protein
MCISELPPRALMEAATGEWAVFFKDKLAKGREA